MKKVNLIIIMSLLTILLIPQVAEANIEGEELKEIEVYFGNNYNDLRSSLEELNQEHSPGVGANSGFHLGARYWTKDNLALGVEVERMTIDYQDSETNLSNTGLLLTSSYRLANNIEQLPDNILLNSAIGLYRGSLHWRLQDLDNIVPGFKVGLEGRASVAEIFELFSEVESDWREQAILSTRANYRYAKPGDLYNFSGVEIAVQSGFYF